jgi:hypothetical protein
MTSEVYFTIIVMSLAGLWFVWDLGLKKLFLDSFREELFRLRFRLFELGASNEVAFDGEAYRATEALLCGLLRYGHRLTFMGFILSMKEETRRKKDREHIDYSKQIELKISRTSPTAQKELEGILSEVHRAVTIYIAVSSLFFMVAAVVLSALRAFNLVRNFGKGEISAVLESEAYRAETSRRPHPQALPA